MTPPAAPPLPAGQHPVRPPVAPPVAPRRDPYEARWKQASRAVSDPRRQAFRRRA